MSARLGINIDHVATLRQARGEDYPSLVDAAVMALEAGADQITIHLREDRRHIQDTDVPAIKLVTERYGKPLNLELGANKEILQVAIEVSPDWICIVPEKREEKTTEGGLNLQDEVTFKHIQKTCLYIRENIPNVKISLFVTSDLKILGKCLECEIDAVEIHTGDFARDYLAGESLANHLADFKLAHQLLSENNIAVHAGHGLTDKSLHELTKQGLFVEYNIGHWVICDSLYHGLNKTIQKLRKIIDHEYKS